MAETETSQNIGPCPDCGEPKEIIATHIRDGAGAVMPRWGPAYRCGCTAPLRMISCERCAAETERLRETLRRIGDERSDVEHIAHAKRLARKALNNLDRAIEDEDEDEDDLYFGFPLYGR